MGRVRVAHVAIAASLALVWVGGCADTDSKQSIEHRVRPGQTHQTVKDGTRDPSTTAIVGLRFDKGFGRTGICSGTLIAPNLVMTAQHCVSSSNADRHWECEYTHFDTDYENVRVTTETEMDGASFIQADAVHRPAGDDYCGQDIALVRLAKSIPASEATPIPPRLKHPVTKGTSYAAVGYGVDGNEDDSLGVRRRANGNIVQCVGTNCAEDQGRITAKDFVGNGPTCGGDSGSGALASDGTVIGVTSRGDYGCTHAILTEVPDWKDFIQKHAKTAAMKGDYPPPVWTNTGPDGDGDGYADDWDNCPSTPNPTQSDANLDGTGNACTEDNDEDGLLDDVDNCPNAANPDQKDLDGDGLGDACDPDIDQDDRPNDRDNCPRTKNTDQRDFDDDGVGDACEDSDGDGLLDANDNCPGTKNPDQKDADTDGLGNACDPTPYPPDADDDGVVDRRDNCPETPNPDQVDQDADGKGDACDETPLPDIDDDGVVDSEDNCEFTPNPEQVDTDGDGKGDVCDETPYPDADGDDVPDGEDNCPQTSNPGQEDTDTDGTGDACDRYPDGTADGGPPPTSTSASGGCSHTGGSPVSGIWVALGLLAGVGRWRRR